ncbi:MAG: response regulator [Desulfocapsaceae bacterium]|nr:response regulator [Desulfocapsaceae bacterium]
MRKLTKIDKRSYFSQACLDLAERSKSGIYLYFVLLALFIFLTDYYKVNPFVAYAGLTFHFVCLLVRITLILKFKQIFDYNSRLWHLLFRLATLAVAGGWVIFWITVLIQDGMSNFLILGLIATVGTVSGGTATLSSDQKLVFSYQVTMLLPLSIALFIQKTNIAYGLSVMLFLGIFFLVAVSRQFHKEYILRLDAERGLVDQAKELRRSHDELEIRVQERTAELAGVNKDLKKEITDRKQSEEERVKLELQLQRAHKMESMGLMAGGVAHDLNNILSGIVGYPELMLLTLPQDSDLRKPIEAIHEAGQRAATVVSDLLTVARGAATIREEHDINTLIEKYLNSPEYQKLKSLHPNVICRQRSESTNSFVSCSPVHVQKCIMNLVTNGCEAIAGAGTISLSTYNQYIDKKTTAEHEVEVGEYVVLSVQDTGPGISKKDIDHIFEPFYTKKMMGKSGSGLGLAVVWNTMEDHGGKVFVDSNEKGTCFQLYFPVNKGGGRVSQTDDEHGGKITGGEAHILVVDDEPQLRDIARRILASLGYRVDVVKSGESAIEFVKKKPVDLLLIDMLMEPGMTGRQTYEEITKLYPNQKAVIASGFAESEDVKATLQLGAGGFIKKPYSIDQLGRAIKETLNS